MLLQLTAWGHNAMCNRCQVWFLLEPSSAEMLGKKAASVLLTSLPRHLAELEESHVWSQSRINYQSSKSGQQRTCCDDLSSSDVELLQKRQGCLRVFSVSCTSIAPTRVKVKQLRQLLWAGLVQHPCGVRQAPQLSWERGKERDFNSCCPEKLSWGSAGTAEVPYPYSRLHRNQSEDWKSKWTGMWI